MEGKPLMELRFPIVGNDFVLAGEASSKVKRTLQQIGIDPKTIRRVAVATYEAEMNVVIHAYRGELVVTLWPAAIRVVVSDEGPGIPDVELAMQEGYSTAPDRIRELGFGAGMGLPNMRRSSDEMHVQSRLNEGTCVTMTIYL